VLTKSSGWTDVSGVVVSCTIYVVGQAPNSRLAVANLTAFCQQRLPKRHEIEVVDVLAHPERALIDKVFLTPTLVIVTPPRQVIIGDLSDATGLQRAFSPHVGQPP
jgi:circadian clock protein KaiB